MCELRILVGLPASGKSTYAKIAEKEGYKVFSSDEYREKMEKDTPNFVVFEKLLYDLRKSLKPDGKYILDALNLSRKRRKGIISDIKDYYKRLTAREVVVYCDLFVVPVEECIRRNNSRENKHGVDDAVILDKQSAFQCPWYSDGFDEIFVHPFKMDKMTYNREAFDTFNQDNPHHSLSLGDHWKKAYKYIEQNYIFTENFPFLLEAIKYHDDGKFFTKKYTDSRGNSTDIAHYYRHENVGAYLFLQRAFCTTQFEQEDEYPLTEWGKLYVANLINWHMRPFEWVKYSNLLEKDKMLLGNEMIRDLEAINLADKSAK